MQIIRTIVWIVITAILVVFIAMNWDRAPVNFWPVEAGYMHFEWPVGIIALLFFLLGLVPMYLLSRAQRWRLGRRITSLENSVRVTSAAPLAMTPAPPLATSTQLEAGSASDPAVRDEP